MAGVALAKDHLRALKVDDALKMIDKRKSITEFLYLLEWFVGLLCFLQLYSQSTSFAKINRFDVH